MWFYTICEISATLIETAIFLRFLKKILGSRYSGFQNIIVQGIAFILINAYMITVNYLDPRYSAFSDIIVLALYIVYSFVATRGSTILKLITPAITITGIFLINLSVSSIISIITDTSLSELITGRDQIRLLALIITKFMFFAITQVVVRLVKPKEIILKTNEYFAVALSFFSTVLIIAYFTEYQYHKTTSDLEQHTVIILICVMLVNLASTFLFAMLVKKSRENQQYMLEQVQFHEQQKMYQSICSVYRNLELIRHDMKNDLLILQNLVHQRKIDDAERFIENYTKMRMDQFRIYVTTGIELIDAILNIKINYAREQNIEVFCNVLTDFSGFNMNDIVSLFSNAIDNAIEASVNQTNRFITVEICHKRNYLCMKIGNAIDRSVLSQNAELKTTKSNKNMHGFGTQSMKSIVDKYDGMMEYYEENGMFFVDVLLKHTKQEEKATKREKAIDF